jgi:hypothetical protein
VTKQIKNVKAIQRKSRQNEVRPLGSNTFHVVSATSRNVYQVNYSPNGCTCDCVWGQHRPEPDRRSGCRHAIAVMNFVAENEQGRCVMAWSNDREAQRQHRPVLPIGDGVILTSRALA